MHRGSFRLPPLPSCGCGAETLPSGSRAPPLASWRLPRCPGDDPCRRSPHAPLPRRGELRSSMPASRIAARISRFACEIRLIGVEIGTWKWKFFLVLSGKLVSRTNVSGRCRSGLIHWLCSCTLSDFEASY